MNNVLLTCVGRRNYIAEFFKNAGHSTANVCCINSIADTSGMYVADRKHVLSSVYDPEYVDEVLHLSKEENISLVVSLFDLELPILAVNKDKFEVHGITVAVSSPEVCSVCLDKVKSIQWLQENGLNTVATFTDLEEACRQIDSREVDLPLYVKPRMGMGSIGIYQANSVEQLRVCYGMVRDAIQSSYLSKESESLEEEVVIQEKLPGTEYGLDVVNDFQGNHVTTFVKRKLAMRSGETDGAVTEDIPRLRELGEKLSKWLGHVGNLDVDVFWDGKEAYVLEMNPRFGGGYPFSHMAGANIPAAYIAWASGEEPDPSCFQVDYGVKAVKGVSLHRASE